MLATDQSLPIMLQLKQSTQTLHDQTEAGDFNSQLVKGRLPRELYIKSLEQLFLIHRALEAHLRRLLPTSRAAAGVIRDYQFQEPYLRDDLRFFERDPEAVQPLPAAAALIADIDAVAQSNPVGLLGFHYVFEGSNNGSKFIARAVRKAYDLSDGRGLAYLDPYGDQQAEYWKAFKDAMNAAEFSPTERQAIVHAAQKTFAGVMRLHRELHQPTPAPAAGAALRCPFHASH